MKALRAQPGEGRTDGADRAAAPDFDSFAQELAPQLLQLGRAMGLQPADAEDVAAEALSRAFASWDRVAWMDRPAGWVTRTAVNLVFDRGRRLRRERPVGDPSEGRGGKQDDALEERLVLVAAMRRLPRAQREAVALRHLVGLSLAEVAALQLVSNAAVEKRIGRGVSRLRGLIARSDDEEPGKGEEGR